MSRRFALALRFATLSIGALSGAQLALGAPAATAAPAASAVPRFEEMAALPFPELKAALERAGWPATHVQAVVGNEIQRRLNPPFAPKDSDLRPFEFWRTGPDAEPFPDADLRAREAETARRSTQVRETFEALFPAGDPAEPPALARWREIREWGQLSAEKRRTIQARLAQAERECDALLQPRGGMLSKEEWHQVWKLLDAARADVVRLLTPEELLDYDLRASATANRLRNELDNFQPSKEEFLAIFRAHLAFDLRFARKGPGIDPAVDEARARAQAEMDQTLARALGPKRFAEYQLSLDPACQLLQFDARYAKVEASVARDLYRHVQEAREAKRAAAAEGADQAARDRFDRVKAELQRQFARHFDEETTRRYLQEQELWP